MFSKPNRTVTRVFLHCTASELKKHDKVSAIREMHLARGWSDVGYHLFIRKDGTLENGRDLETVPAAQKGHNTYSIAICLHGLKQELFTAKQFKTLKALCLAIDKAYGGEISFHGHREVAAKACPVFDYRQVLKLDEYGSLGLPGAVGNPMVDTTGDDADALPEIRLGARGETVKLLQRLLFIKDDGIFGPKTATAVRAFKRSHNLYPSDIVATHVWRLLLKNKQVEHFD